MLARRATADVALLRLAGTVAAARHPPQVGAPRLPIAAGDRFTIAGIGVTVRGDGKSGGTIRVAGLVATGRPGTLQIRLVDPVGQGTREPGAAFGLIFWFRSLAHAVWAHALYDVYVALIR